MFPIELTTPMSVDDLRVRWTGRRDFSGRHTHSTGPDCARWQARSRDSGLDSDDVRTPTEREAIFNRRLALAAWGTTNSRGRREVRRAATACIG